MLVQAAVNSVCETLADTKPRSAFSASAASSCHRSALCCSSAWTRSCSPCTAPRAPRTARRSTCPWTHWGCERQRAPCRVAHLDGSGLVIPIPEQGAQVRSRAVQVNLDTNGLSSLGTRAPVEAQAGRSSGRERPRSSRRL